VRIKGFAHCQAAPLSKVVVITGELTVQPVQGLLDFADVCTKAPVTTDCPARFGDDFIFSNLMQITVEQPKGTPLFPMPGLGVIFP
jgi:hypothetical protein